VPEPTLNLTLADYQAEAGSYLGWGRDPTLWDDRQAEEVRRVIESAQRGFYFAAQPDPRRDAHTWTFLRPVADFPLTAGVATAPLPDDFGGFDGPATVSLAGSGGGFSRVDEFHEEQLRAAYAAAVGTAGRPTMFAERQARGTTGQRSERPELYVWPLPDAAYVLAAAYRVLPNAVTPARPFPYGGAAHAETMKAAVRAAAERLLDNRQNGPEQQMYVQLLAASISDDRRHQPKTLGRNADPSDARNFRRGAGWPDGAWHPLGFGYLGTADWY
jgi:hypothetical protein